MKIHPDRSENRNVVTLSRYRLTGYRGRQVDNQIDTDGYHTHSIFERLITISDLLTHDTDQEAVLRVGEVRWDEEAGEGVVGSALHLSNGSVIRLDDLDEHELIFGQSPVGFDLMTADGAQRLSGYLEAEREVLDRVAARLNSNPYIVTPPPPSYR